MCFMSLPAYFCLPRGMDGTWGRECHSYHLTYELAQTRLDIDMLQMLVEQSNATVTEQILSIGLRLDRNKFDIPL